VGCLSELWPVLFLIYIYICVCVCVFFFFFLRNVKFGLSMGKDKLEFMHESHKCENPKVSYIFGNGLKFLCK